MENIKRFLKHVLKTVWPQVFKHIYIIKSQAHFIADLL